MQGGVSSEAEPPTKKQKKIKTHNEVNNIEGEAAAAGKGFSEEEGRKDLENKATLTTIVSTLKNISRKFDQIDSRFDANKLDRNRPLMDQKTIDDMVKALVEERLKVLRKIHENNDNLSNAGEEKSLSLASRQQNTQQKSINSPALGETPSKVRGPKNNLAKELDKDTWVKRTLAEEFGRVAKATDLDSHLDFVYVSSAKATKDDKDNKVPAYGHGCRRTVKDEDAADKKKAVTPPRANVIRCMVEKSGEDSDFAVVDDEVLAEENELAP
ncbi:hypothetical protein HID58_079801, partial [Brassica napus]